MSRRAELISPEGLRLDGRRAFELRAINASMGVISGRICEGSSSFACGNTRVLATVFGPREVSRNSEAATSLNMNTVVPISDVSAADKGKVSVKIHAASFSSSGGERRKAKGQDRRLLEWSRYLEDTFSAVIQTSTFPRAQLDIFVEISNADGSVLAAAFNAITLALLDAGVPMDDYIVAGSCSYVQGQVLLDPNRLEETSACPVLVVAMQPRRQTVAFINSDMRLAHDKLPLLFDVVKRGVIKVFDQLDTEVVRPHLYSLLEKRTTK